MRATGIERDSPQTFSLGCPQEAKVDREPGRVQSPLDLGALRGGKDVGAELDVSLQPLGRQEAQQRVLLLEQNCCGSPMTLF